MSLSRVLADRTSPVSRFLRGRFPHVGDLQRRYREPIAHMAPIATEGIVPAAYGTIGTALDWRLRFLLTPQPNLHIAAAGAAKSGKARMPLAMELLGTLNGQVRLRLGPGRQEPDRRSLLAHPARPG